MSSTSAAEGSQKKKKAEFKATWVKADGKTCLPLKFPGCTGVPKLADIKKTVKKADPSFDGELYYIFESKKSTDPIIVDSEENLKNVCAIHEEFAGGENEPMKFGGRALVPPPSDENDAEAGLDDADLLAED